MQRRTLFLVTFSLLIGSGIARLLADIDETVGVSADDPAIQYADHAVDDPVARLAKQIESGKVQLKYAPGGLGYLPDILKKLDLNIDSQVLVFSKTSFQNPKISPWAPRALYFNDNVAVGSVQGGDVLEFASLDPKQGVIFYTLDIAKTAKPEFDRRTDCLQCHQGINTLGIPGVLVTSVFPGGDGMPAFRGSTPETDDRTPFEDRWGGWYVTGTHGTQRNMGNAIAHDSAHPRDLDYSGTQNLTSLGSKFPSAKYLAPTSDIVALMVLEHQTRMANLMIRAGWDARTGHTERLDADVDALVSYMLFAKEQRIYEPIQGVSTFTATFPQRGPRDKKGRSLRDFDLQSRMFKYPLSYMIYSEAFDGMPDAVKEKVYQRLYDVLTGKDQSKTFARLSTDDRQAVLEILRDTKPNLPEYWKTEAH